MVRRNTVDVFDKLGRLAYSVFWYLHGDGSRIVLPKTLWSKEGHSSYQPLSIPLQMPSPLLNENMLADTICNAAILFDSIEIAGQLSRPPTHVSLPDGMVLTAWYGGIDAIDTDVDWSALHGKKVHYVICNHSKMNRHEAFQTARRVYRRLIAVGCADVAVYDFHTGLRGSNQERKWNWSHFMARRVPATELEAQDGQTLQISRPTPGVEEGSVMGLNDHVSFETVPDLLSDFIPAGTVSLIYASAGVGKTWLALHLACSVASSTKVFDRWTPDKARTVLYVDGEMGGALLEKWLNASVKVFTEDARTVIARKLFRVSVGAEVLDLSTEEGQEVVERHLAETRRRSEEPVSLLILDNLGALTGFSDTTASWKGLFGWLKVLKRRGISTIIVHHTNKTGAQRGSEFKLAAVDNAFHVRAEGGAGRSTIAISIEVAKGRELHGLGKRPITVEFSPSAKVPKWRVRQVSSGKGEAAKKERDDRIIELAGLGWSCQEIADDVGLCLSSLKRRKSELKCVRPYKEPKKPHGPGGPQPT
jgi:putative DNA primase/helicase